MVKGTDASFSEFQNNCGCLHWLGEVVQQIQASLTVRRKNG